MSTAHASAGRGAPGTPGRLRAAFDRALIGLFLLGLGAPLADELLRDPEARDPSGYEQRAPAAQPRLHFDVEELGRYPRRYEDWYLDRFGLRDRLLRLSSCIRLFGFGVSPTPLVEIGRGGWLFYTGDSSRAVFNGERPFRLEQLESWKSMLANHEAAFAARGIAHVYVFGPNKETLYPEEVPPGWSRGGPTRYEQLLAHLAADPHGPRTFDLRPALQAARAQDRPGDPVYYPHGTHWSGRGGYAAYRAILEELGRQRPGLAPLEWEQMSRIETGGNGDTWARAMYIEDLMPQYDLFVAPPRMPRILSSDKRNGVVQVVFEGPDRNAPRAVMFHDSFGQSIQLLLAAHFSRLTCLWTPQIDSELLAQEEPDVVLEVFVERALWHMVPDQALIYSAALNRGLFERSDQSLLALGPHNRAQCLTQGAAQTAPAPDGAGTTLELADGTGYLVLPPLELPPSGDLLVHLSVEASRATDLVLMPVRAGEDEPRRRRIVRSKLAAGPNELFLVMPRSENLERIAFRPMSAPGQYTLHSFEVRAMKLD